MKKNRRKQYRSVFLLLIFVIGQAILYGHIHHFRTMSDGNGRKYCTSDTPLSKYADHCDICDQLAQSHFTSANLSEISLVVKSEELLYKITYSYDSIDLIAKSNRGPPPASA